MPFSPDPAGTASENGVNAAIGQNRKILVVDDNPVVLKAFELKLKASGFAVLTADEGAAAVSLARQQLPDLIVLDITYPPDVGNSGLQWDGFNIMQWLRRFKEAADIPIIIISGGDPLKYKERSLRSGAAAFFQKPVDYREFLAAVVKLLEKKPVQTSGGG
jgi:two-component system cell cycle response regulator DivK